MPDGVPHESVSFVVFSDDWGRHPSSCQHLFRQLLPRYRTFWVNTIGMRRPRFDLASLRRGLEKLLHWTRRAPAGAVALPENLHVSNPRMWPWFSTSFDRRLNRFLLARHLRRLCRPLPAKPIVVTTIPIVADLISVFPEWRWVYYCVDDFGSWPGIDQRAMQRMEERLVRECDRVIAVSEMLRDKLARRCRHAELLTHGVDLAFWATQRPGVVEEVRHLSRPLVVFWGVVDRRMDVAWVKRLAAGLSEVTIVLVGPKADPAPELLETPGVVYVPPLDFEQLPQLAREASVLVMPYADLPVTRTMQPLKLKEYLATGRPAVVRDLPANREWADCMDMVDSADDFVAAVQARLRTGLPVQQRAARARLEAESWAEKARLFERWVLERPPFAAP
jgi:glycosyltransferase involved in cell wall biosynthesis